jgi:hypothetical protein
VEAYNSKLIALRIKHYQQRNKTSMKSISKQTAILGVLVIALPILLNFIIGFHTPNDLNVVGHGENWLGFYGSYIGGVITAGVAFAILWHNIEDNKKNSLRNLKKEDLYNQRKMMAEHISNINFYSICYISMFVSQKNMYQSEVIRLNALFDKTTMLSNSFNLLYGNPSEISIAHYKRKYNECSKIMIDDINQMIQLIYRLILEGENSVGPDLQLLIKEIDIHQRTNAQELFQVAQQYLEEKQNELDEMYK